ncbi:MAG: hypothetical protein E7647_02500 [Ruminococcaceae bacterium]|nr:hypothetical protein [Oscillospiraceae bacterium]
MIRRGLILIIALSVLLCSCTARDNEKEETTFDTDNINIVVSEVTTSPPETEPPLPCLIGFYDELTTYGNYTRLTEWHEPWVSGKDIAVFDVIPSSDDSLVGSDYKELWVEQSEKISPDSLVKPYFLLEYTLKDGTEKALEIKSYVDAEAVIAEGYLEVYLYDDIHQDGGWYYHLTENTTNEDSVISSFKLTAGKEIYSVKSIRLTAYIEGSSGATVVVSNGY